jgi:hypothetical protein
VNQSTSFRDCFSFKPQSQHNQPSQGSSEDLRQTTRRKIQRSQPYTIPPTSTRAYRSSHQKMVRISIPTIKAHPEGFLPSALTQLPVKEAAQHLSEFLKAGKGETLVLTGAGVSVDSGIRAYRGKEGHYSNPNYTYVYSNSLGERADC